MPRQVLESASMREALAGPADDLAAVAAAARAGSGPSDMARAAGWLGTVAPDQAPRPVAAPDASPDVARPVPAGAPGAAADRDAPHAGPAAGQAAEAGRAVEDGRGMEAGDGAHPDAPRAELASAALEAGAAEAGPGAAPARVDDPLEGLLAPLPPPAPPRVRCVGRRPAKCARQFFHADQCQIMSSCCPA